MANGRRLENR